MVRLLDRTAYFPLGTRPAGTLHDRHPSPQRDGHAPHGAHAQQHVAGRAGAPRPHVGKERLLGAGHGPRVDRHRSQGGGDAARKGHRKVVAHARGVPPPRLGMEGEIRRRDLLGHRGLLPAASWAPRATGTARASRWTKPARRAFCASSATSTRKARSTAA
jgi:hypothetical protein